MGSGLPVVTNKVRLLTPAIAWANPDIAKHKRLNNIPVTTNCPDSSVRNKAKRFPVCKKLPMRITKTKIRFLFELLAIKSHRIANERIPYLKISADFHNFAYYFAIT